MILQSLARYYGRMDAARDSLREQERIPPLWFAQAKVSYGLCLKEDGTLTHILPLKQEIQAGKKTVEVPQSMTLPLPYVRGVNILANFLCDNALFLLGYDYKGDDHSAARGQMALRELIVFKHESELGNAPAHKLFDLVSVNRREGAPSPTRSYADYKVEINLDALPQSVTCMRMV